MIDQELFVQYKNNQSIEIRNEIVEKYLYMVDILIRKYLGKGVEYDDCLLYTSLLPNRKKVM